MDVIKILNLFAGIGGNRTLWGDKHEITAIENNQQIALIYHKRFPNDKVIITDAYDYFLKEFHKYNFIWASPPCISHTRLIGCIVKMSRKENSLVKAQFPDLRLYSLILFCKRILKVPFVIENVKPYYDPLIDPTSIIGRHYIWSNITIPNKNKEVSIHLSFQNLDKDYDKIIKFKHLELISDDLMKIERKERKQILNNTILPQDGKYILDCIENRKQQSLEVYMK